MKTYTEQEVRALRIAEVDRYADYLSDCDDEVAFEVAWQEYAYRRIRDIDAEEAE